MTWLLSLYCEKILALPQNITVKTLHLMIVESSDKQNAGSHASITCREDVHGNSRLGLLKGALNQPASIARDAIDLLLNLTPAALVEIVYLA